MPQRKLCREPAAGGPCVLRVNATDELFFPHVDSCMAITFLMSSGAMLGGHVPMQWGANAPLYPPGNARRIIQEMSNQAAGETIVGLISLCDLSASLDGVNPAWPLDAIYLNVPIQGVLISSWMPEEPHMEWI